jgi:hypothetical protein
MLGRIGRVREARTTGTNESKEYFDVLILLSHRSKFGIPHKRIRGPSSLSAIRFIGALRFRILGLLPITSTAVIITHSRLIKYTN